MSVHFVKGITQCLAMLSIVCFTLSGVGCAEPHQDKAIAVANDEIAASDSPAEERPQARDEDQELRTAIYFTHASAANELGNTIGKLFRNSKTLILTEDRVSNAVIVRGTAEEVEEVHQLLRTLDRQPQIARFTINVFRSNGDVSKDDLPSGSLEEVEAGLAQLQSEDRGVIVNQMQVTALEDPQTRLQVGQQKAVVTGTSTPRGGGGRQSSYQYMDVGSLLQLTHRVTPDDEVIVAFEFNLSRINQDATNEAEIAEGPMRVPSIETITHQSTLRIHDGQTMLVTGNRDSDSDDSANDYYVYVGVELVESDQPVSFSGLTNER